MKRKKRQKVLKWCYRIVTCAVVIALPAVTVVTLLQRQKKLDEENEATAKALEEPLEYNRRYFSDEILEGVTVAGCPVGGLTKEQAEQKLNEGNDISIPVQTVELVYGEKHWTLHRDDLCLSVDVALAVQQAWNVGRVGEDDVRQAQLESLKKGQSVDISATIVRDEAHLREVLLPIKQEIDVKKKNASVTFSYVNGPVYTYTDETVGFDLNLDTVVEDIKAAVARNETNASVTLEPARIEPEIKRADLERSDYRLCGKYTTTLTDNAANANRTQNIRLALESFNNRVWMPGEMLSFNLWVGARTAEKGYGDAVFINQQQQYDNITGGGICQVSTTVFNAALLCGANMRDRNAPIEIIERFPHTWPSVYVPVGLDATVNWPGCDLKLFNNNQTPYFIHTYMSASGRTLSVNVEIYGAPLPGNAAIRIETEIVEEIPVSPPEYVIDETLSPGKKKQVRKPYPGYTVNLYQIWTEPGKEPIKSLITVSKYGMLPERIAVAPDVGDAMGLKKN